MSRNRRRFSPHDRKFNNRMVERPETDWQLGLSTDSIRTPVGAVEELENARSYSSELRGRIGTVMHNRADYQVETTGQDYDTALLPGGPIFDGKGSAPVDGDIFMTTNAEDFFGDPLTAAKRLVLNEMTYVTPTFEEDFPRAWAYDFYEISGIEQPIYLGNLAIPHFRKYIARATTTGIFDMRFTKVGNTITRDPAETPIFQPELAGMYITYGQVFGSPIFLGARDYIVNVIDSETLTVSRTDTVPDATYRYNAIQASIHASYYHQAKKAMYIHSGEEIYEVPIPIFAWRKIPGLYDRKPFPSDGLIHEVKGDLILTNPNGRYRIDIDQSDEERGTYYWKINTNEPNKAANKLIYIFGFPTSPTSNDENPFGIRGFSGRLGNGGADKTGGFIL